MKNTLLIFTTLVLILAMSSCTPSCDKSYPENMDLDSVNDKQQAMDGLDVVSCYNKTAVKVGADNLTSTQNGVHYKFMTAEHKALFDAAPKKYMPQIGGYCVVAAAHGKVEKVDNEHYGVYNGKLYFTTNKKAYDMWMKDQANITAQGESMWPCLVEKKGRKI